MKQAFSSIKKANNDISFQNQKPKKTGLRLAGFILFTCSIFVILILRLLQLTIVKGNYYRSLSEQNRLFRLSVPAQRGPILDRKGLTIANSIAVNFFEFPFMTEQRIVSTWQRIYPYESIISHALGYLHIVSDKDLDSDSCEKGLQKNDQIGALGIEKLYDCHLRGVPGILLIEKDTTGKPIKILSYSEPQKGKEFNSSIDFSLQQKAAQLFPTGFKGAIIMSKPKTGEIIVYISFPSYDPNLFQNNNPETIFNLFSDKDRPMFDRIAQGTYPPGSTFKLPVLTGALQDEYIQPDFTIEDTGQIKAGPITFGNWYFLQYGKTEGIVDPIKALKRSNDIFFYRVGEKMGPEAIKQWAETFGYGTDIPFPFPHSEGLIPNEFWKKEQLKENWYLGDTYNMSIGQGYILTSPLQVHHATLIVSNNGLECPMTFEKKEMNYKATCIKTRVKEQTLNIIHEGMKQACATGGTGWPFFDFKIFDSSASAKLGIKPQPISVSCKTGTAESHSSSKKPHAWFTAYAPSDYPEVAITILVEESGEGSYVAAPVAKELLKAYFERVE